MILIWDNGERYDGHETLFLKVPVPGGYACEVERLAGLRHVLARLLGRGRPEAYLIGWAEDIAWEPRQDPEPFADYIAPSALFKWKRNPAKFGRDVENVVPRDEAWQLGKMFVGLLHLHWNRRRRNDPELDSGDRRTFLKAIDAWVRSEEKKS